MNRQRIFIAAWPDTRVRDALRDTTNSICQTGFKGKTVKPENLHITVVFLGDLVPAAVGTIQQLVNDFVITPATLHLDRLSYWRKPRVVWLGYRNKPTALIAEIESLRFRLKKLGFRFDEREFVPHATLFRKATRRSRVEITPIEWLVTELTVVRSTLTPAGSNYEIIAVSNNK